MVGFLYSFWWLIFVVPLVPLFIHLINLLRHELRPWAAMEFLLKSHKKHSQYVWLMQLLLLLLRMVIAVALVALLAQLITPEFSFLRGITTHHYVILDDTYSMGDRVGGESAFDRAQKAIVRITDKAKQADGPQRLTLIRYSKAARATPIPTEELDGRPEGTLDPSVIDITSAHIDLKFDEILEEKRREFKLSEQATSPLAAIKMVQQLSAAAKNEKSVVYIVSDFRKNDWDNPVDVRTALQNLTQKAELQLVACVDKPHPNLGITYLAPENRPRSPGGSIFVDIHVKNFGKEAVRNVEAKVRPTGYVNVLKPGAEKPAHFEQIGERYLETTPPPKAPLSVNFKEIGPGETATERAQVSFPAIGEHVVEVQLPDDAIAADNRRWCVVEVSAGNPVLVIDGGPGNEKKLEDGDNFYYLQSAFDPSPGEKDAAKTGVVPEAKTVKQLLDMSAETLSKYHAVYLLNVARLDLGAGPPKAGGNATEKPDPIVEKLEAYVRDGGGVGIFLGPNVDIDYYNRQLYRNGQGLFPYMLGGLHQLPAPTDPEQPQLDFIDHPIFKAFSTERNAGWRRLSVSQYFQKRPKESTSSQAPGKTEGRTEPIDLAKLSNGHELVVEHRLGLGKSITFFSSLAPEATLPNSSTGKKIEWNNYLKEPAGVVMLLEMQAYLQSSRRAPPLRMVGSRLDVEFPADFDAAVKFAAPQLARPDSRSLVEKEAQKPNDTTQLATLGKNEGIEAQETESSGIYDVWLKKSDTIVAKRYALNVDPDEGNVAPMENEGELKAKLAPVAFTYRAAWKEEAGITTRTASPWSEAILVLLILILIGEQALAFVASFHPTPKGER